MEVTRHVLGSLKFDEGWALRPKAGATLGSNTVNLYLEHIKRWYQNGNKDKGKKISGVQMQLALELRYPDRYDIPAGQHIKNAIIALNLAKRKR